MRYLAALATTLLLAAPAHAQTLRPLSASAPASSAGVVRLDLNTPGVRQSISIPRGKSATIEFSGDVREAQVTNPMTADVRVHTPRRISILGLAPGQTDAAFFDASGRRVLTVDIRVDQDIAALSETITRVVPGSNVMVEAINESVILTGVVESMSEADAVVQTARLFVAKPENVLNRLTVAAKDQVMLRVRIVEIQRNVIKQLGFDLDALFGEVGERQFSFANAASFAVNGGLLGGLTGGLNLDTTRQPVLEVPCAVGITGPCYDVIRDASDAGNYQVRNPITTAGDNGLNKANAVIKAFERVGLLRTLAEPNLTAVSGEAARFLAGGEYPVPNSIDDAGRVSVSFKPYGVGLGFTPVVLSGGRIALKISTEVSELTSQGAFTLQASANTVGLTIPALTVRRAETSVEAQSGSSMMIAGLLREETRQTIDKVPGVSDMPVLGALARSRDFLSGETELVVIVTPYLVKPTAPGSLQTPADGLRIANDAQTLLLGRINAAQNTPPAAVAGRTYQGSFGHVIE